MGCNRQWLRKRHHALFLQALVLEMTLVLSLDTFQHNTNVSIIVFHTFIITGVTFSCIADSYGGSYSCFNHSLSDRYSGSWLGTFLLTQNKTSGELQLDCLGMQFLLKRTS